MRSCDRKRARRRHVGFTLRHRGELHVHPGACCARASRRCSTRALAAPMVLDADDGPGGHGLGGRPPAGASRERIATCTWAASPLLRRRSGDAMVAPWMRSRPVLCRRRRPGLPTPSPAPDGSGPLRTRPTHMTFTSGLPAYSGRSDLAADGRAAEAVSRYQEMPETTPLSRCRVLGSAGSPQAQRVQDRDGPLPW